MLKKISLRKALQTKKTLVGDIAKLRVNITKFNSQRTPNPHVDVNALVSEYQDKTVKLMNLKTAITNANVGIYGEIIKAEEFKSQIALFESLDTDEEGLEYRAGEAIKYTKTVAINYTQKMDYVKTLRAELEEVLDKIDGFNTHTMIEVDL